MSEWEITVVDRDDEHHYQPGYLFLPFGAYCPDQVVRTRHAFLPDGVDFVVGEIDRVDADARTSCSWRTAGRCRYDYLVIATGTTPAPGPDARACSGREWRRSIFDFYTLEGAEALAEALRAVRPAAGSSCTSPRCRSSARSRRWSSPSSPRPGCASAGIRDRVELVYVTPLDGAFTKPVASAQLGRDARGAQDRTSRPTSWSSASTTSAKMLVSYDEREVPFDLLVTVPLNMGADFVARSGLGDELNYVPGRQAHPARRRRTTTSSPIGDASDIPDLEGRLGGALLGRGLRRQLPRARRRPADDRRASTGTPTASSSPATTRRC